MASGIVLFGMSYILSKTSNSSHNPETANTLTSLSGTPATNSSHMLQTVDPDTFATQNAEQNRIIIDVRTPEEFASGYIEGATNVDFYEPGFADTISQLDKNAAYSVYCRSGNRSGQTLDLMESLGFTNVLDLEGGIGSWVASGRAL